MVRYLTLATSLLLLLGGSLSAQAPLIEVYQGPVGSTRLVDGASTVEFGSVLMGTPKNQMFTIRNVGATNLVLTEPISVPVGFTVMRTFGRSVVPPGETTTFVAALNAASAGRYTGGQISFVNNDTPRSPFNFNLTGSALPEPAFRTIDNGDSGFRTVGAWTQARGPGYGYQNNVHYKLAGTGTAVASWTFKGLTPGLYQVSATWTPTSDLAPDARFTIRDGSASLGTTLVNLQSPNINFTDAEANWHNIGGQVLITSDTLVVQLSDQATAGSYLFADSVRVTRAGYNGRVVDDGSADFTRTGTWIQDLLRGFQGDSYSRGPGAATATWTFSGLGAGSYRVSATWRDHPGRASNALYTILNGATPLGTARIDQRRAPKDIVDGGARWTDVGAVGQVYAITGTNPLVVMLNTADATGTVSADAVRVERVNTPAQPTIPDTVRFLDQATWGPNAATLTAARSQGIPGYINAQFATTPTGYPFRPIRANNNTRLMTDTPHPGCGEGSPVVVNAVCNREHYTSYFHQRALFENAFYGNDQLRQRVAWALHKILVADLGGHTVRGPASRGYVYLAILDYYALGNFRDLLYVMTLNPGMGDYLDMIRSRRTNPNENYARELLQLFSIGVDELHPDGTPWVNDLGNRVPTYTQPDVVQFSRALTGWDLNVPHSAFASNWHDFMTVNNHLFHDVTAKTLLQRSPRGRTIAQSTSDPPSADYIWGSFDSVIDNVFYHPNTGPYICKQLIQMMVTSNPTPGYVARVSAAFDRNRASPTQMRQVIQAILLDPEARGDVKSGPNYGKLREPVQFATNMGRAFGVTGYTDRTLRSDGALSTDANNQINTMEQNPLNPPSVFSYFLQDNIITGSNNLSGPEFQIYSTLTAIRRHNFTNTMLNPNGGVDAYGIAPSTDPINRPIPNGTKLDLRWATDAMTPTQILNQVNLILMGNRMTPTLRSAILDAISVPQVTTGLGRAKRAMYLVLNSPEYLIQR